MQIRHNNKNYSLAEQQHEVYKLLVNADSPLTNKQIQSKSSLIWPTNRISELLAMGIVVKKGRKKVKSAGKVKTVNTYII